MGQSSKAYKRWAVEAASMPQSPLRSLKAQALLKELLITMLALHHRAATVTIKAP